jgi:hypothetical protein
MEVIFGGYFCVSHITGCVEHVLEPASSKIPSQMLCDIYAAESRVLGGVSGVDLSLVAAGFLGAEIRLR